MRQWPRLVVDTNGRNKNSVCGHAVKRQKILVSRVGVLYYTNYIMWYYEVVYLFETSEIRTDSDGVLYSVIINQIHILFKKNKKNNTIGIYQLYI